MRKNYSRRVRRGRYGNWGKDIIIIIIFLLVLVALFSNDLTRNEQEESYDYSDVTIPDGLYEWNGHSYYIFADVCDTWEAAKAYCEAMGGYLAVISSEEENDMLFAFLQASGYNTAYFGYSDSVEEGNWVWVANEDSNYTNWASGEPNSETSKEDYAEFYYGYTDGKWNDGNFNRGTVNDQKVFICEWSYISTSDTASDEEVEVVIE